MANRNIAFNAIFWMLIGLSVSAVMLPIMQAPWDLHALAWVAWVPFVLACAPTVRRRGLILLAYPVALGFWLFNLSWLQPVTGPGFVVFALWQAVYWPVLALTVRFVRQKQWPLTLWVPLLLLERSCSEPPAKSRTASSFTSSTWMPRSLASRAAFT